MRRSLLITGVGVLWSGGAGLTDFRRALLQGRHALGKLERCRAEDGSELFGGVIDDRLVDQWIATSARRGMDRFGRLNVAGATLTARDAGFTSEQVSAGALSDAGLILSTTFGPWESTNRFVNELIDEGPLGTSARVFPNTVLNSAQGRVSIALKIQGPSTTLTGLPALAYAYDLLQLGRLERVLAGGVEEIYPNQLTAYSADGTLAPQSADEFLLKPFDAESAGSTAAEGFAACFCESVESAERRGAPVLARVLGYGTASDGRVANSFASADPEGRAFARAMALALENARVAPTEIDTVVAAANGCRKLDAGERSAIAMVLGRRFEPILPVKSVTGECFGASTALALAAAVALFDGRPDLQRILVNGVDIGGNHTSFVLGAPRSEA